MKKKFAYAFFAITLAFVFSCSNESAQNNISAASETGNLLTDLETKVLLRMRDPNNRVSIDEAMEQANWVIDFLNGENSLKSGSNRRVSSISALVSDNKTVALKSSDLADIEIPDTLAYIANFGDDLGFAIISADTRIDEPLFAFTGSGSLVDSIDNPGVIIFLQHLEDYMINSIVEAEHQQDSLLSSILEKLDIEVGTKSTSIEEAKAAARAGRRPVVTTETLNHITPLVPVEWGQGGPFNNGLKDKDCYGEKTPDNGKPWAGCVATAVAHIMSRWEHPSKIGNFSFNWNELNQYTSRPGAYPKAGSRYVSSAPDNVRSQLANLMKQIGDGAGMSHGCYGSSAKTEKAISFLNKHGFSVKMTLMSASNMETTGVLESYNSAKAIASMNRREPLIVEGCSEKTDYKVLGITVNTTYDVCHAWVIDGHLKRRVTTDGVHVETDYIHNNWGWNGYKNGYFKSGVFDSRFEPALASGTKSSKEDGNFQYRLKMTPHIRR